MAPGATRIARPRTRRATTSRATGTGPTTARAGADSGRRDVVRLQPELEHPDLPQRVAAERRRMVVRLGEEALDHRGIEQPALARDLAVERVADEVQVRALEVPQRGHGEVALG